MKINPFAFGNYGTLVLILSLVLNACEKNNTEPNDEDLPVNSVELTENTFIIEEDNSSLISDSAQQANGTYIFQFNNEVPSFKNGDVIVGQEGNGFLRKIKNITLNDNTATLETDEASLDEVFKNARINFSLGQSNVQQLKSTNLNDLYLANGVSTSDGFTFSLDGTEIIKNDQLNIQIKQGSFSFSPDFQFEMDYEDQTLNHLDFRTKNSTIQFEATIDVQLSKNVSLNKYSKTLAKTTKRYLTSVGFFPILVVVETQLDAVVDASVNAALNASFGMNISNQLSLGATYDGTQWTGLYELTQKKSEFSDMDVSGNLLLKQTLTIIPKVNIKLYNILGPYVIPTIKEVYEFGISSDLDRNSEMNLFLDNKVGVNGNIFGKSLFNYSKTYNYQAQVWNSPDSIEIVSGSEQTGNAGEYLSKPIKIKVVDLYKNAVPNIPVYFNVETKYGKVSADVVMTDENGIASVEWELGDSEANQKLLVYVKKSNGSYISGVPLTVSASALTNPLLGEWEAVFIFGDTVKVVHSYYGNPDCPDLLTSEYSLQSFVWKISPDKITQTDQGFHRDYTYSNLTFDCSYDNVSSETTNWGETVIADYELNGNNLTVILIFDDDDDSYTVQLSFPDKNTLILTSENGYTAKFIRK